MPRRAIYRVRWNKQSQWWALLNAHGERVMDDPIKKLLISDARRYVRGVWRETGTLTQLVIHNKDGKIQRGNTGEATYGKDPKRSKG